MNDMYKNIYQNIERELDIMLEDIEKDAKQSIRRKRYSETDEAFNNGAKCALNTIKAKMRAIKREELRREWLVYNQKP